MTEKLTTTTSARSARISPDRMYVGVFAIILVTLIMVASYIFSYATIADAAIWSGVPEWAGWVRFLAPVFIDGAILTYTVSFAIYRWRREAGNAKVSRRWLWTFTMVSVLVNGAHAAAFWQWDLARYEAWFGMLIAVSAPLAALVSAEEVVRLSFQREELALASTLPVSEVAAAAATEPEQLGPLAVPTPVTSITAVSVDPQEELPWEPVPTPLAQVDPAEVVPVLADPYIESEALLSVDEAGLFVLPNSVGELTPVRLLENAHS